MFDNFWDLIFRSGNKAHRRNASPSGGFFSAIFDSLRRWTKQPAPTAEIPVSTTIASIDAGGIDKALISARQAPDRDMISNDEVAAIMAEAPDRRRLLR